MKACYITCIFFSCCIPSTLPYFLFFKADRVELPSSSLTSPRIKGRWGRSRCDSPALTLPPLAWGCMRKRVSEKHSLIDAQTQSNGGFKGQTTRATRVISLITDIDKQRDRGHMFGVLLHLRQADCCAVPHSFAPTMTEEVGKNERTLGSYWSVLKNTSGARRR